MIVPKSCLSNYQLNLVNKFGGKYTECVKLVPNLHNKKIYVIYYRNLKLYKSLGLNITKIHRAMIFKQPALMAPYIKFIKKKKKKGEETHF